MNCHVAREALSARIDGEREPVPSARVGEHVASCRRCAGWYTKAREQAEHLQNLAGAEGTWAGRGIQSRRVGAARTIVGWCDRFGLRAALAVVGVLQVGLAVAQATGIDFGMVAAHHGAATGAHLLNESTAWCAALGTVTVAAALRPALAAGLTAVLVTYVGLLSCYVIADAAAEQVTAIRIASHIPVTAAAVLAVLVWQADRRGAPPPHSQDALGHAPPVQVRAVTRAEHLRSSDGSAA